MSGLPDKCCEAGCGLVAKRCAAHGAAWLIRQQLKKGGLGFTNKLMLEKALELLATIKTDPE